MHLGVTGYIISCSAVSLVWAFVQYGLIAKTNFVDYVDSLRDEEKQPLKSTPTANKIQALRDIHDAITVGAEAFLTAEYSICGTFVVLFSLIIFLFIWWSEGFFLSILTTIAYVLGAVTSIASGYIGMKVAVFSNVRTTINAQKDGYARCFNTAFRAGSVMGFALTGLGLLVLYLLLLQYSLFFGPKSWFVMMACISGYGLGGSTIALFGRVGGGIYTKAADVGADLVGKIIHNIPEDDPRNPATIADNVGDNVGDVAGMGADLFGSFAESSCACLLIAAQTPDLRSFGWAAICYPLTIIATGILVSLVTSFIATDIFPVKYENRIELSLRLQLIVSCLLNLPFAYWVCTYSLPKEFEMEGVSRNFVTSRENAFSCIAAGSIGALCIGLSTEYYTSKHYSPVNRLVQACKTGAATNIIAGLALGYSSVVTPVFILAFIIYWSFIHCDLYGISLAAIGMLSNLPTGLTIDAYGPVCDNAGGIAEMAGLNREVRRKTDALDSAGNTTAAIGKGFAIGSASLVSLALFSAFVIRIRNLSKNSGLATVSILSPITFAFLLIGAMLPFWFSAMTMRSVGEAAMEMVREVQEQFQRNPELLAPNSSARPDYERCVSISTKASLREMIAPGALVIFAPLITGILFGVHAVFGLLTGALLTGVQLAISMSNTGGAWDNAKKYIEANDDPTVGGKGSEPHRASVIGDTVGDPLKDTSGPSLNILMKLMAIISLVFAEFFYAINQGNGYFNIRA